MTKEIYALQFSKHHCVVFAYAIATENSSYFETTFKNGSATKLPILDKNGDITNHVDFKARVKQLINNTERGDEVGDDVYFLLTNGDLVKSKFKDLKSKSDESINPIHVLSEEQYNRHNDKKMITLLDVYDNKLCVVFNDRLLLVTSVRACEILSREIQLHDTACHCHWFAIARQNK